MTVIDASKPTSPRLLRERPALRDFIFIRAAAELAAQMLNVALGWRLYAATNDPMSLAYVGLAQFAPSLALVLIGGQAADRFDRRRVVALSLAVETLCFAIFAAWSFTAEQAVAPIYLLIAVIGGARAFFSPAVSALLPRVAGEKDLPRAVAAVSSVFQACSILGPAIGGLLYAISGPGVFVAAAALLFAATVQARRLPASGEAPNTASDRGLLAGVKAIVSNPLLFALISLDLFAVLLGGVSALLPIYAKDILAVGPFGLGCLRGAPGLGAAFVGLLLAHRAIKRGAGKLMLAAVAGFGLATIVFALSANLWLSLIALAAAGGFDMISMVIRQTMIQVATPDALRGRVSAVNWAFIGASAELGDFESGVAAALFGAAPAALVGGLATLIVVALWAALFPELREADRLKAAA
jgi:MFS family permease